MSHRKRENKFRFGLIGRNALFSVLKKVSISSWSRVGIKNNQNDQLTQDDCEALWVRINKTLHSFN
jgi:hypothetical protein